jgi:hypothetical protein
VAVSRVPAVLLLPARLHDGDQHDVVRHGHVGGCRALGRLRLGRWRRRGQGQDRHRQVQQLQQDRHQERRLEAQRRPPQGRSVSRQGHAGSLRQGPAAGRVQPRSIPRPRRAGTARHRQAGSGQHVARSRQVAPCGGGQAGGRRGRRQPGGQGQRRGAQRRSRAFVGWLRRRWPGQPGAARVEPWQCEPAVGGLRGLALWRSERRGRRR